METPRKLIVVEVSGGCAEVYTTEDLLNCETVILDRDNIKAGDEPTPREEEIIELLKGKALIDVDSVKARQVIKRTEPATLQTEIEELIEQAVELRDKLNDRINSGNDRKSKGSVLSEDLVLF